MLPEAPLAEAVRYDLLIVSAGIDGHLYEDKEVFAQLRRIARRGMDIGALTLGSYLLARAGLLDGYRCTVHWENLSGFIEEFPQLEVTSELFEIDRDRFTCSGGIAAFDLMLHVITGQHGFALASAVSDQFIHERIRDKRDRQRMALPARLGIRHPKLLAAIRRMEENLEEPVSRSELARTIRVSSRQLERLFRKYLGRTPTRFYLDLRLDKARQLLQQTDMTGHGARLRLRLRLAFLKCYRERFRAPRAERQRRSGGGGSDSAPRSGIFASRPAPLNLPNTEPEPRLSGRRGVRAISSAPSTALPPMNRADGRRPTRSMASPTCCCGWMEDTKAERSSPSSSMPEGNPSATRSMPITRPIGPPAARAPAAIR